MNYSSCEREHEIIRALKLRQLSDDLRAHSQSCQYCREALRLTSLMSSFAEKVPSGSFPSSRMIWLKAQYSRKQERLSKLDFITLGGMWLVGFACIAALVLWRVPQLVVSLLAVAGKTADIRAAFSASSPYAVVIGVLLLIWLITKDTFFTARR